MKIYQQTKTALGSSAMLTIRTTDSTLADSIFNGLWNIIFVFEKRFSRFLTDSELTHINNSAGRRTKISPEAADLVKAVIKMANETDGLYNPFILPALQRVGYRTSWIKETANEQLPQYDDRSIFTIDALDLDEEGVLIPQNAALDFGGIGKGYLLDKLANYIEKNEIKDYWFSLGGDVIARGEISDDEPWSIAIEPATSQFSQKTIVRTLSNNRSAVATSGVTKRHGVIDNKPWHHLIDPRTGESAKTDILTASVVSESGLWSDVFASCLVVCGTKEYRKYMQDHNLSNTAVQYSNYASKATVDIVGERFVRL